VQPSVTGKVRKLFQESPATMSAESNVIVLPVEGMTCHNCVQKIEAAFSKLESVNLVKVRWQYTLWSLNIIVI